MYRTSIYRSGIALLVTSVLLVQYGCAVDRLRKPIADFQAATTVVTAQARLSYSEVNRIERIRAITTARRLKRPLKLSELEAETTLLRGEDLATRLDALDHLSDYTKLLSQIVNSDAPDKIATSANNLETSLNGLAERISKLSTPAAPAGGAATPNTSKFKDKFGVFTRVVSVALELLAKKKQNDALKNAIKDGDAPVSDLIEAIRDDLKLSYENKRANLDHDLADVFKAYNKEILKNEPDGGSLEELSDAIISNLDALELFKATDPSQALDEMKDAHKKMVAYASKDSESNLNDALASIQLFVSTASRLGEAVIKLRTTDKDNS